MDYKRNFQILCKYMKKIEKFRPPFEKFVRDMSKLCTELLEVEKCIFWMYDDEEDKIYSHATEDIGYHELSASEGIIGHVIKTGKMRIVNDTSVDPYYNPKIDDILGFKNNSSIYIPLKHSNNTVYGAIQAINKKDNNCFDDEDDEMLLFVSLYCEEALTSYFFESELLEVQNDIVFLLAELGESRSKETAMHVRRVSAMCEHLAKLSGFSPRDVYLIKLASPLHDIGKVAIPDSILNKPGRLNDEEYEKMKSHTIIAHRTLGNLHRKLLKAADVIAFQHHERYDGKGYPLGLIGEKIHPYARITAICDVFDALANERIYKHAWPKEEVYKEFENQIGKQFDPDFCKAFLENFEDFYDILAEYPEIAD
ncbi:HD domain protein [Peptoanaerobacter stomatis]|uniref:HD domain protein n=1 Tax=Peptoanaerobacter stomatis TaxID=796937 RepID=J4W6F5_9FIRM|nr:HD domain-containing phosphohydrolase [Peptoanaerobacter stomatis]EJU21516.1 HD domain protein [Peptoanaerobacter stomatis]NWO24791.1 HD domain-containing protein [Peptostreptococcaceae bacterium oral taxon 081]